MIAAFVVRSLQLEFETGDRAVVKAIIGLGESGDRQSVGSAIGCGIVKGDSVGVGETIAFEGNEGRSFLLPKSQY